MYMDVVCSYMYVHTYVYILIGANAVLSVEPSDITENLATLNAEMPCSSPHLECFLSDLAIDNISVTVNNITNNNDNGLVMKYRHPNHTILLSGLNSGTTYNYCVIAIINGNNATEMKKVGKPMCGTFTTSKEGEFMCS